MSEPSAQTIEKLLRRRTDLPEGWQTCHVDGPIHTTRTSQIYRAFIEGCKIPLAVKHASAEDVREQFDAMAHVAETLGDHEQFKSPNPIALLEEDGILVMEWIDGPTFQDMCLDPRTKRSDVEQALGRCAKMMAALHKPAQVQANVLDTADFLNDITIALKERPVPPLLEPALGVLQKTSLQVAEQALPVTTLHGDFKSANLLLTATSTYTIDAAMKWDGATVHDAAHFLNQFALDLYHPKAWRLRPGLKDLEALFLATCETAGGSISILALDWLRLQKLIMLLTDHYWKKSLSSKYLVICLRCEIRRAIRKIEA